MCWSKNVSLGMAALGMVSTYYSYIYVDKLWALFAFYLTIMQLIHYFAYILIDDCDNYYNKALSYINYIHVSFQPFFFLLGHYGLFKRYNIITKTQQSSLRLLIAISAVVCIMFLLRIFPISIGNYKFDVIEEDCAFCGKTCSFQGIRHVDFKLPLRREPYYFTPSIFFHFMFFFISLLFFNKTTLILNIFYFVSASLPSLIYGTNTSEAATLWCGIAVVQWIITLFYVMNAKKIIK